MYIHVQLDPLSLLVAQTPLTTAHSKAASIRPLPFVGVGRSNKSNRQRRRSHAKWPCKLKNKRPPRPIHTFRFFVDAENSYKLEN